MIIVRRIPKKHEKPSNLKMVDSFILDQNGGDDRIRTCEGLLTLNDLANRRFQPLSHISILYLGEASSNSSAQANFVKAWCITHPIDRCLTRLTRLIFRLKIL
jgi:hypothetical protein